MNTLISFGYSASSESELYLDMAASYGFLTLAIPIMIALMLIMTFIIMIGTLNAADESKRVRRLLQDIFEEKLDEMDKADELRMESEKAAWLAAREERQRLRKPATRKRRIIMGTLAACIPILLIILAIVAN